MIIPTRCPCCNDPLLNEFIPNYIGECKVRKSCLKVFGHKFVCMIGSTDIIETIGVELYNKTLVRVNWVFSTQQIIVTKGLLKNKQYTIINLPYFEPDFSDYNKLIKKLRTYMVFS